MKKFLFSVAAATLVAFGASAQTTVWDFADYSLGTGTDGATTAITNWNGLTIYPCAADATTPITNFGVLVTSAQTFPDNFAGTVQFKTNGGASLNESLPRQRYVKFDVSGVADIKVWYRAGGSSARTLDITQGTTSLISHSNNSVQDNFVVSTQSTGAGTIYIYGSGSQLIYKIEATNAVTSSIGDNIERDGKICTVTGYFNLLGQKLADAPAKGAYIETYSNCPAQKFVK